MDLGASPLPVSSLRLFSASRRLHCFRGLDDPEFTEFDPVAGGVLEEQVVSAGHQGAHELEFDLAVHELFLDDRQRGDVDADGAHIGVLKRRLDDGDDQAGGFGFIDELPPPRGLALEAEEGDVEVVELDFAACRRVEVHVLNGNESHGGRLGHVRPFIGLELEFTLGFFQFHDS